MQSLYHHNWFWFIPCRVQCLINSFKLATLLLRKKSKLFFHQARVCIDNWWRSDWFQWDFETSSRSYRRWRDFARKKDLDGPTSSILSSSLNSTLPILIRATEERVARYRNITTLCPVRKTRPFLSWAALVDDWGSFILIQYNICAV